MSEFHTRTIKLKLIVTNEDKKAAWKRIRQIMDDSWKAANWIASGQYLNDQLMRRVYARRKIDPKDNLEAVQKVEEEFQKFFGTKRQATTERDIKDVWPNLPPCVTNPMNQVVVASYNSEKQDMLRGARSLRTYREGMPVTTTKISITLSPGENGGHTITWRLGRTEQIVFAVYYGRDKANNRLTVQRIIDKENDYSAPQIQLKDRDLFLLLPVKEPRREYDLDPDLSVGVDLGLAVPAYVALSNGPSRRAIGSREDFLRVRMQMQARLRNLQRNLKSVHGGKGREKKIRALERVKDRERNFSRTYNHYLSKEIVEFAIRNRAGTIKMEMLEGFGEPDGHDFVLRNWSYFDLQKDVDDKAKRAGIKVVKIDPYHTSQTCSECGHFEPGQRKSQSEFVCAKCGAKIHADYNAAVNIARSDKVVKSKEECECFKQHAWDNEPSDAGATVRGHDDFGPGLARGCDLHGSSEYGGDTGE